MIKKRNLHPSLINWIQGNTGIGYGLGNVIFLAKTASSTSQFKTWLQTNGVDESLVYTDITKAYAALVANRNDVLVVLPGSHTVSAAFEWGKDFTHMVGSTSPVQVNTRARFSSTVAALSPMITFSADGSIMKNVMWSQEGSHATTAAICCAMTGDRNYLEGVTLRNLGALAVVDSSMRNLKITSSNGENHYKSCTIGADSFDAVEAASACIEYAGTETARDIYEECIILHGGSANAFFVKWGASSTTAWTLFKRNTFLNNNLGTMDFMGNAFSITGTNGNIILQDNLIFGATSLEDGTSGLLFGRNAYAAATTDSAVALTF
jgi:hypothetical protein